VRAAAGARGDGDGAEPPLRDGLRHLRLIDFGAVGPCSGSEAGSYLRLIDFGNRTPKPGWQVCALLLAHGAKAMARNLRCETALDVAGVADAPKVVQMDSNPED